ncbi:MAG: hypothetical protein PVG39_00545 [Desulfobacteraceae bacterium]|jgi:hypothetical protein
MITKEKLSNLIEHIEIKPEDEWLILSHMIMNSEIMQYIYRKYKSGQIKTKHFGLYFQHVFRWLVRYFKEYERAPKQTIQEVYNYNKQAMNKETADIIAEYLDRLATEFSKFKEDGIDPEFIKKEVIPRFQKRMEAELVIDQLTKKLERNEVDDIGKVVDSFTQISDDEEDPDLGTAKPGSIQAVRKYYSEEKDQNVLFRMPGAVGEFMGPICKSKLYAITGIEKSGKTWTAQEIGRTGVIYNKLKWLDINLEMPTEDKEERFWQRETGFAIDEDHAGKIVFPIFDCQNNQHGTCEVLRKPLNKSALLLYPEDIAAYDENKHWQVCTKCREERTRSNAKRTKRFIPAIWFKTKRIKVMTERRLYSGIKAKQPYGIGNYRIKCFPRFSATLDDVIEYIYRYIRKKNFKPHGITIDYPDIMAPIQGVLMDRFNIDYNWKKIAGLSQELDCAIFVADQGVKAARNKRSLDVMDTSESKTKDAHIDMRLTLNKTLLEYELGLERLGMLFRRKGRLHSAEIMMTQRLETGNVILDSEWWWDKSKDYQVCKTKRTDD